MTRPSAVSAELAIFLTEHIGLSPKLTIDAADEIERDFGVTGDDADVFIAAFCTRFSIDPGDYLFQRYFRLEGFSGPLAFITKRLLRKRGYLDVRKEPLTVAMLQRAIELGRWDTERLRTESA